MKRLLGGPAKHAVAGEPETGGDLLDAMPVAPVLKGELEREAEPLFRRADTLATHYANTYRSAYIFLYMASVTAVVLALSGFLIPGKYAAETQVGLKTILIAMELLVIGLIIVVVAAGKRNRWHQKWMDYRALAERLRHLRFLSCLGAHRRMVAEREGDAPGWVDRLVRKVAGRIGLPDAVIDAAYVGGACRAVRQCEVEPQERYHRENAQALARMNHALHRAGNWCFHLTALVLAAYLLAYGLHQAVGGSIGEAHAAPPSGQGHAAPSGILSLLYSAKSMTGFLAAALPAIGAALSGIRFTGEFDNFSARSEAMAQGLNVLGASYAELEKEPVFDQASLLFLETATTLGRDIEDWKTLYTYRKLDLPA